MSTIESKEQDDGDKRGGKRQKTAVDEDEWARFQAEVLHSAALLPQKKLIQNASATIEAEPVLLSNKGQNEQLEEEQEEDDEDASIASAKRIRQKAEQEAKEEILSRLDEEQRAQEEADQRVQALKDRLQRIREKRKKTEKN